MTLDPPSASAPDLARSRFPRTLDEIEHGRNLGLHQGAQLAVSLRGERIADLAVGEDAPGEPLSRDHLMFWLSTSKPITAVAIGQLWERGSLALDDAIARHVPEFGAGNKEAITIRHALTHTGGFRMFEVGWPELSWEETIARVCASRREPRWEPGRKAGYHQSSSWFILGEVIRRLSGKPFEQFVREEIFEPLGMDDCWIGMPAERHAAYGERIAASWRTGRESPGRLTTDDLLHATRPSPAGGGRGPMHQLLHFYEMLLGHGIRDGRRVLSPQTVEALTARHRAGLYDHTFRHVMDWGLGFIPDSKHYGAGVPYAYGPHCSHRTFGHSGYRSSTAFADPEHGLAVALAFNGLPDDGDHARRMRSVLAAIYLDLGLAEPDDGEAESG